MSLGELLETCRSRRIELWSEAGRLRYRAPQGALDAGLAERLRAEREALLEHPVSYTHLTLPTILRV